MSILFIRNALQRDFSSSMAIALGITLVDVLYAAITLFGLSLLSNFLIEHDVELKIIGLSILLIISFKLFQIKPFDLFKQQNSSSKKWFRDFISAFLVTASNPLSILFFGSIFNQVINLKHKEPLWASSLAIIGLFIGSLTWWVFLNLFIQKNQVYFNFRKLFWINKLIAIILTIACIVGFFTI